MDLLEVKGLKRHFGGLAAISDLNFEVRKGEILGLIGPNGSGKTTTFNLITGVYEPTAGQVRFKGEDITGAPANRIAEKGIVRTWQVGNLFADMTVLQSVTVGCHLLGRMSLWRAITGGPAVRKKDEEVREEASRILDFMGLNAFRGTLSKHLPHGLQRRLGIAIALGARPELLLLDEPIAGMNPEEINETMKLVRKLNAEEGITILLVEHNMRVVMNTCDRIFVLYYGRKIAEGLPKEIASNPEVIQAYLGGAEDHA